ncbi:hypothetical protein SAMN03080617_01340 [Algoriphagus alkaliphilus]|uniref:Uncharacterized protein n=1 Tax=Algoriphagus alkaliphilus TaxID=279824 RepID=A0A1G5WXV7_9BACT|nr:hypothetical protein SAMN03080617_01340 [Algoriphagus alkaliphilus]
MGISSVYNLFFSNHICLPKPAQAGAAILCDRFFRHFHRLFNKKIKEVRTVDQKAEKKPKAIASGLSHNLKALSIIFTQLLS